MNVLLVIGMQGTPQVAHITRADGAEMSPGERAAIVEEAERDVRANWDNVCRSIVAAIHTAKEQGDPIILLEDAFNRSRLDPVVSAAVIGTAHIVVRGYHADRSADAERACQSFGIRPDVYYVCGALTDVNVVATVRGLRSRIGRERVKVLQGAVYPPWEGELAG